MKKTVGVIFGGVSGEHEVSKLSAMSLMNNIDFSKFNVQPVYIDLDGVWFTSEKPFEQKNETIFKDIDSIVNSLKIENPNLFGFRDSVDVFFPIVHGTNGEDGTLQGLFEVLNIPYVGCGVLGSAVGMDKAVMKDLFAANGIPQGKYAVYSPKEVANQFPLIAKKANELGYPVFVKPANAGSSVGITKVKEESELQDALMFALKFDNKVIVEETITGRELEIGMMGYDNLQFSAVGEVTTTSYFYDYKAKYSGTSETQIHIPAKLSDTSRYEMMKIASDVCKTLNCYGISRIDFFFDEENNRFYVNEINTLPGFTAFSMYPLLFGEVGIPYDQVIEKLIGFAFDAYHATKKVRTFS